MTMTCSAQAQSNFLTTIAQDMVLLIGAHFDPFFFLTLHGIGILFFLGSIMRVVCFPF
jgi:hypothetical protein